MSNVLGAKLLKKEASGTMPHSFILCVGDEVRAWEIFDEAIDKKVPRIVLVDTLTDEKVASIRAFETLGSDTLRSPSGYSIVPEGKYQKDRPGGPVEAGNPGGKKVKIFVSGGLDEAEIVALRDWVDGFGVGASISTSP